MFDPGYTDGDAFLEIQTNSETILALINDNANAHYSTLIADCRSMMSKFTRCIIKYCYREANGVANALSKQGVMKEDFLLSASICNTTCIFWYDGIKMYSLFPCWKQCNLIY